MPLSQQRKESFVASISLLAGDGYVSMPLSQQRKESTAQRGFVVEATFVSQCRSRSNGKNQLNFIKRMKMNMSQCRSRSNGKNRPYQLA